KARPAAEVEERGEASGGESHDLALRRPALEREEPARPLLDEQDDRHQDHDFAEDRTRKRLEELVGDAEAHRTHERAHEAANAAEHHDEEAVDDIDRAEIGT